MKNPTLTNNPRVWRAANLVSCNLAAVAAVAIILSSAATAAPADASSVVSSVVTDRTACSRTWLVTTRSTDPATGQINEQQHAFTELANGLHYWQDGRWMESQDLIELTPAGAAATKEPNKVTFSPGTGAAYPVTIDTVSPSGVHLQSKVLGLFYFDAKSGQRVALATLQDSTGVLYAANVILYPDCLAGPSAGGGANANASLASLVYTYCKGGFSQDVLLSGPLPAPESYGLDPATTRLQVATTFYGPPTPTIRRITLVKADPIQAMGMVSPDLTDDFLVFGNGDVFFPVGQAVLWDNHLLPADGTPAQVREAHPSDSAAVLVGKEWIDLGNGTCQLVESIPFASLAAKLKAAQSANLRQELPKPGPAVASGEPRLGARAMQLAQGPARFSGLLVDYVNLSGQSSYGYTFTNTTYVITNNSSFSVGPWPYTANFQSNACIKLGTNANLTCYGAVSFPSTGPASVVFTSQDDNVYGETIPWSTGVPNPSAQPALSLYYPSAGQTVQNARFRWAKTGLEVADGSSDYLSFYVTGCKFENCPGAIGIWDALPNGTLYLSSSTYCNVSNALYQEYGESSPVYGSLAPNADVVDVSRMAGAGEAEGTVAINPLNSSNIVAISCIGIPGSIPGLFCGVTTNAGLSWRTNSIATGTNNDIPLARGDPKAAFDRFGNLFLAYESGDYSHVYVVLSTNGGLNWSTNVLATFSKQAGDYILDKPGVATGPAGTSSTNSGVWVLYTRFLTTNSTHMYAAGATATGLGSVGAFGTPAQLPYSGTYNFNWGNIAVGTAGQVVASYVTLGSTNSYTFISRNTEGLANQTNWNYVQLFTNVLTYQTAFHTQQGRIRRRMPDI